MSDTLSIKARANLSNLVSAGVASPFPKYKHGFSLIEILITLVVLSVGLLGIAGLQVNSMRFAHNANLRYQAMLQANDMADRIRANRPGMEAGAYDSISGSGSDPGCITTSCTPAQIAQYDQFEWNAENAAFLPAGRGTVSGSGANSIFTITVFWTEVGAGAEGAQARNLVVNFQP